MKKFTPLNLHDAIIDQVYNYYGLNLRNPMHEESTIENLIYESSSASDDSNMKRRYQRRIMELESIKTSVDESYLSFSSPINTKQSQRRQLLTVREDNSSNSE